ncbi:unnamed protein product [Prorocentrum cordatum]|uniref:Uncharacterized protein n=1 Tax=Prorocentrum cordatum TaxID=2364126 RepID=A0ABN9UXU8_9DINO|nr:unnamed protein product [Polarella glacialis]
MADRGHGQRQAKGDFDPKGYRDDLYRDQPSHHRARMAHGLTPKASPAARSPHLPLAYPARQYDPHHGAQYFDRAPRREQDPRGPRDLPATRGHGQGQAYPPNHVGAPQSGVQAAKSATQKLSDIEVRELLFSGDAVAFKLLETACALPPDYKPDLPFGTEDFINERKKCNAEMMRRCICLCTAKTRREISLNAEEYCPYIMRAQARRNLQNIVPFAPLDSDTFSFSVLLAWISTQSLCKRAEQSTSGECLSNMTHAVAALLADQGQAHVEATEAIPEAQPASAHTLRALSGRGRASQKTVTQCALDDIKKFKPDRMHQARNTKTIDWAMGEAVPTEDSPASDRQRFAVYRKALDAIVAPKGRSKKPDPKALAVFKDKASELGVRFDEKRLGDLSQLLAAIMAKTRSTEI